MKRKDDIMGRRIACHELVEELVRRWYPTMSAMEIVKRFGLNCHYQTIERYARSLGVKKDASFREAWNKKVGAANRRTYLMERLREHEKKQDGRKVHAAAWHPILSGRMTANCVSSDSKPLGWFRRVIV